MLEGIDTIVIDPQDVARFCLRRDGGPRAAHRAICAPSRSIVPSRSAAAYCGAGLRGRARAVQNHHALPAYRG
jgi:hypothetical protein